MIKVDLKLFIIVALIIVIALLIFRCDGRAKISKATIIDTVATMRIDTIKIPRPYTVRYKVVDTIKVLDTVISKDTLYIPITQRIYQDSSYTAYVSGYRAVLDSITLFNRTIYKDVTTTITIPEVRPKRWGIGLSAGYCATPKGLQPYLGVGVNYNVIIF
ncbi:MAG: hypothetical protein RR513_09510 [Muribaculaceae bacterium]